MRTLPSLAELTELLASLIPTIEEDFRAFEDDDGPSMQITIGVDEDGSWGWQTGDNSFTGGAYSHAVWGVGYLTPESDPEEVARALLREVRDGRDGMRIELSVSDDIEQEEEGWRVPVTAYADPFEADEDQSIEGSSWETPSDLDVGYAGLDVMGPGEYTDEGFDRALDALVARLDSNGYRVTVQP